VAAGAGGLVITSAPSMSMIIGTAASRVRAGGGTETHWAAW
jgi:hypothetical protein